MACFIVPLVEGVAVSVGEKIAENVKNKNKKENDTNESNINEITLFKGKTKSLKAMLYGGSALLALEHLWHGEITLTFPFLTAAKDLDSTIEMLKEMGTSGVMMSLLVTFAWVVMCSISYYKKKKDSKKASLGLK